MVVSSRKFLLLLGLGLLTGLGADLVHAQIPPGYEVIRLTDDPDMDGPPAINNLGHVVWSKRIDQGFDTEEIFLWDGVQVRRITNDNVRDAFPDINDNGTIVWSREKGPGETENFEIAVWQDRVTEIITDDEFGDWTPQVNNLDHVVWGKHRARGCTEFDIFFHDGESTRQITNDGFSNQAPAINDFDELVWTRYNFCVNPWRGAIMLHSQDETTQLSDGLGQDQSATINNNHQVAWGWGPPDQDGIALWEDGVTRDITSWGRHPRFSCGPDVAFHRWHEDISSWQQCAWVDGEFIRLSDEPVDNLVGRMNDCDEVAWVRGDFPETDILLLRLIPGDANRDNRIDLQDYEFFPNCLRGPQNDVTECACRSLDHDRDGDVDLRDYVEFQFFLAANP